MSNYIPATLEEIESRLKSGPVFAIWRCPHFEIDAPDRDLWPTTILAIDENRRKLKVLIQPAGKKGLKRRWVATETLKIEAV